MTNNDNVFRVLDASTAHISWDGVEVLETGVHEIAAAYSDEFGWWIYVSHDPEDVYDAVEGLPQIMHHARGLGCRYVRLDRDGPIIDGLQVWDW